jgi:cellulose synthase/poly-beta-1,6-N-acetylglucosamine synthase-like glycosyltransferase
VEIAVTARGIDLRRLRQRDAHVNSATECGPDRGVAVTIAHWLLTTFAWVMSLGPLATILWWGSIWARVEHSLWAIPTLRLGQKLASAHPPTGNVCVVVPAHNEARVIAGVIRSLRSETYSQLRVVMALDRCTDDTALLARTEIAGDARFEVLEIDVCPADWSGKVHALHTAVTGSRVAPDAEFLIFADADTLFSPGCIAAALALLHHRKLDLLSLLSTLTYDTWFERVVQLAAGFELLQQYPLTQANALEGRQAFANGQFMLFKRDAYDAVGGHVAVRDALLEDLALARLVEAKRLIAGVFVAAGLFHCRMYADWPEFRRGWKRIYIEAADRKIRALSLSAWRVRWLGTIFPTWTFAAGACGALIIAHDARIGWALLGISLLALLLWAGPLLRLTMVARAPAWTAPLHIIGAWLTAKLLDEAASDLRSRKPTTWGGREYDFHADGA